MHSQVPKSRPGAPGPGAPCFFLVLGVLPQTVSNSVFGLGRYRRPTYRNAANDIHRTLNHRPDRSAQLLMFGEEECEYALAVRFAGCHKYTHWSNGNSRRPQSMLHVALCSGCITAKPDIMHLCPERGRKSNRRSFDSALLRSR